MSTEPVAWGLAYPGDSTLAVAESSREEAESWLVHEDDPRIVVPLYRTVDLDVVDLTTLVEAVARATVHRLAEGDRARSGVPGPEWDDMTALARHNWIDAVLPFVHDAITALKEQQT